MVKKLQQKKIQKMIWKILAVAIITTFLLWGSGSIFRSQKESGYVGRISGRKVLKSEYDDARRAVENQLIIQFQDKLAEIEQYLDLSTLTWERLILFAEAKKRKIKITDQEVIDAIRKYPFFQDKGKFDQRIYSQLLQHVFNTKPRDFEEQVRATLMVTKLYEDVTNSLNLTDAEIREAYQKENEQMSIYYIAGLLSEFAKNITVSEEELKDYFAKNPFEFKKPLSFNIEYITLDSEEKIKSVLPLLKKKDSFTKLARDSNLTIKETGLFSQVESIPGIGWSIEILNLISNLKEGQISAPLRVDKNFYIIRLKERKEPYIPDFGAVKDKIKEVLVKNKSLLASKEKVQECLKKLKEQYKTDPKLIDLEFAAKECRLTYQTTDLFKYGSYIEGIGSSDRFFTVAKKLKEGEFSEIVEMSTGFYIIRLKSLISIDEKKFLQERDGFAEKLLLQKKQIYFNKFLQELKQKAQIF